MYVYIIIMTIVSEFDSERTNAIVGVYNHEKLAISRLEDYRNLNYKVGPLRYGYHIERHFCETVG